MMTPKLIAEQGTFLISEVGSSVHGINISGLDDLDLMGVCFQPASHLLGLQHFAQFIYRTAEERAKHNPGNVQAQHGRTPKSEAGDIDLTIYSVQKFLKLALAGNPSILVLFFSKKFHAEFNTLSLSIESMIDQQCADNWATSFLRLSESIASLQAGPKFLGYLRAQKDRMLGLRGQMRVHRPELISKYSYDVKFACHACRLGLQGIEYMKTGRMTLPMPEAQAETLRQVRRGELLFSEVIDWIDQLDAELLQAMDASPLPKYPDHGAVDDWLTQAQLEFFEWQKVTLIGLLQRLP